MFKLYIIVREDKTFYAQKFKEGEQPDNALDISYTGKFIKPIYENGEFKEGASIQELEEIAVSIDFNYTLDIIPKILTKHVQKKAYNIDYQIPLSVIEEVERLRNECNENITNQTGITDFSYRQNYPELM